MKHRYDQVRIIASPQGITIMDEHRKALTNVFAVNIALRANKPPVMQLNMIGGSFDIVGRPTFMAADPAGGPPKPVKSIEFWDGTGLAFPEPPASAVVMQPPAGGPQSADPAGTRPITPVAAVQPIVRQPVALGPGETAAVVDGVAPPAGTRWETDAELRDRAIAAAEAASKQNELPDSINPGDAPKLDG